MKLGDQLGTFTVVCRENKQLFVPSDRQKMPFINTALNPSRPSLILWPVSACFSPNIDSNFITFQQSMQVTIYLHV